MIRLFSRWSRSSSALDSLLRERTESLRIKQLRQRRDDPTPLQVSVNAAEAGAYLRGEWSMAQEREEREWERAEKLRRLKVGGGR